jgi:hypothetical protein
LPRRAFASAVLPAFLALPALLALGPVAATGPVAGHDLRDHLVALGEATVQPLSWGPGGPIPSAPVPASTLLAWYDAAGVAPTAAPVPGLVAMGGGSQARGGAPGCAPVVATYRAVALVPVDPVVRASQAPVPGPVLRSVPVSCPGYPGVEPQAWTEVILDGRVDIGQFIAQRGTASAQFAVAGGMPSPMEPTEFRYAVLRGVGRIVGFQSCGFGCATFVQFEGEHATVELWATPPPGLLKP